MRKLAGLAAIFLIPLAASLAQAGSIESPTNLSAVAVSTDEITLSWAASTVSAVAAKSYNIYRNGGDVPVASSKGAAYIDTGLAAGTSYSYAVSACAAPENCSAPSAPATSFTFKWLFTGSGSGAFFTPAIGKDGTLYDVVGGGSDVNLYAINPDGTEKWSFPMNGAGIGSPAIDAGGNIYAASTATFYSINSIGDMNWTYAMPDQTGADNFSPAIGADGTIYIVVSFGAGPGCGLVVALNSDGSKRWQFSSGAAEFTPPVIGADGTIYVGAADVIQPGCGDTRNFYAINPDGDRKWAFTEGGGGYSGLAIDSAGNIDATGRDSFISLTSTGAVNWVVTAGSAPWTGSPAIDISGNIYAATGNDLYSVGPTGAENWDFNATRGTTLTAPALAANGTIYTGTSDAPRVNERLFAIDLTGAAIRTIGGGLFTSPTIGSDGTVYAGDEIFARGSSSSIGALIAIPGKSPLARSPWPKAQHDLRNSGSY